MRIEVNGTARDIAATTLADALAELGWAEARVATALNGEFVPSSARPSQALRDGDRLEVLAPMQGG
ncbi:sulfur carrier protein ThiS [Paracoccus aestuarii]|uniref:Sulfur carrier protein ThiS n=1 Tax=Paracoccus aestuarii TaxID=453842 RepID=A0A418ZQY3_9RHOB|nr:sulfur carrier protein ThiS [Paracoccus aestuarii]RJK98560.1 sulfur carrier protein ThiS [Paracoccus aestuarii]WCR00392.1 sulfur carrier protein ThiS [Paracoccus aestuarii]